MYAQTEPLKMTSSQVCSVISLANHNRFDTDVMGLATLLTRLPVDPFLLGSRTMYANPIGRLELVRLNEVHPQQIRVTGFKNLRKRSCNVPV